MKHWNACINNPDKSSSHPSKSKAEKNLLFINSRLPSSYFSLTSLGFCQSLHFLHIIHISTSIFPSLCSFTVHTIIFSSYPFTPLNVSTSPSLALIIYSPVSYPLRLTYQSPALPLCQHLPPLGSEQPMYPHERERWESLKYWWPQARATSGTLCRGCRPGQQSHWVRVAELQWRGQVCRGRWKRGGGKQMRRSDGVCVCVPVKTMLSQLPAGFVTCVRWFASGWSKASSEAERARSGWTPELDFVHTAFIKHVPPRSASTQAQGCLWAVCLFMLPPPPPPPPLRSLLPSLSTPPPPPPPPPPPCPSFLLLSSISLDIPPTTTTKPLIFSPFSFSAC